MKVSIVIPVFNEEKYIKKCLLNISHQTVPADEIIVVNNNCTDKTIEIAKKFDVRIVNEKKQGMTPARNRGFDESRYEIIARCDADVVVTKDWIKRIKYNFENKKIDALSGPVTFTDLFNKPTSSTASKIYLESLRAVSKGKRYLIGPNMSLTKKIWIKVRKNVNMDDKKVHEDVDLSLKIRNIKGKIGYDPKLIVGISARRLKKHPESFFVEYPIRMVKTFWANKKD